MGRAANCPSDGIWGYSRIGAAEKVFDRCGFLVSFPDRPLHSQVTKGVETGKLEGMPVSGQGTCSHGRAGLG